MESEFDQHNIQHNVDRTDKRVHIPEEDFLFKDGKAPYRLHKPNSRHVQTAKFIVHKYVEGHTLMSSLCSILHWNLGHQNGMLTISAYLNAVKSKLEATKPSRTDLCDHFSPLEWFHVWAMHCISSLLNPEREESFYKGCSTVDAEGLSSIDDLLMFGMEQPLHATHMPHCYGIPSRLVDINTIAQIVFLQLDMELSVAKQAEYRTIFREKPSGTRWWKFDMQSTVQPFQLLGKSDNKLWRNANVAYYFAAPRP
jgi:hypothetical protein